MKQQTSQLSLQERMIRQQIIAKGIDDPRVVEAMRAVSREAFFPSSSRDQAYADGAAAIGHGQTISQPYIVALMTQQLDVQPQHTVLEIGTGSGYQTAILARLAGEVFTVERVKPLLDIAFERLMTLAPRNVHFKHGDGTEGWPGMGPFDRILISAGAPDIPRALLLGQLKDGGVAVLPSGPLEAQMLVRVTRHGGELSVSEICACRFVKLIGAEGWRDD